MIPETAAQQYMKQPYRGGRVSICIDQALNKILYFTVKTVLMNLVVAVSTRNTLCYPGPLVDRQN